MEKQSASLCFVRPDVPAPGESLASAALSVMVTKWLLSSAIHYLPVMHLSDDDSFRKRDQCPDLNKCSLNCLSGFQLNEESCYICKCKPDCKDGYKLDSKGMEICECAKPYSICPSLENCKKQCTYGLKVANNGCQKCSCNKCPPFSCGKKCANGYTENHQDCKLCKCKDNSRLNNTPSRYDSKHTGKSCLSVEGQLHEDGDSWHDGCRMCYCYGGQEMCALISCPHPSCTSPVFRLGDCCLSCPGNIVLPHKGKREMCESLNGRYFVEGETWYLDNCTQCLCHSSSILCETQACPPLLCSYPTILPNTCCPVCQGQEEDKSLKTFSLPHKGICHTNNRFVYSDGDVWKTNPCQSCTCRSGQVHCVSQVCPAVTCPKSVLRKGSCCPTCLDLSHQKVCTDEGVKYTSGEHWLRNNCTKCYCIDGKIVCVEQSCPTIHCKYMTSIPGDCCPVCLDEQTTIEEQTLPEPGPSVIVKEEAEKDPIKNNKNATTIIICVLAAMVIILLLLLVFFFLFKYGKWKSVNKKYSPKSVDIENIHPVQVKLLGYEMSVKPVKKSEQSWNPDLLPVSKLNNEEKHVNLLSQEFDKTKLCQI
ncbi:cysteine-rich motor neuron 1 protein-like isoform X3 [Saccostrea cucullata]|uniref:cysteine-rich motor neuron 1 protein-like isoform X3 n=1 Tax=Saccostrea cuccullata TaxID=36930 RepID=UPI002ED530B8